MKVKRALRITGLGVVLWALSLIWPEVNRALSSSVMLGLAAWLGLTILFYLAGRQPDQRPPDGRTAKNCSSRPAPTVR